MDTMFRLLRTVIPAADADELKFKIVASMNNVDNGLAYRSYMWRSPFGASPRLRRENADRLRELLMRHIEGGLRS